HALEGGPRGQTHRRREFHAGGGDREVAPGRRDLEHTLLRVERSLRARQLLDPGAVELRPRRAGLRPGREGHGGAGAQERDPQSLRRHRNLLHGARSFQRTPARSHALARWKYRYRFSKTTPPSAWRASSSACAPAMPATRPAIPAVSERPNF